MHILLSQKPVSFVLAPRQYAGSILTCIYDYARVEHARTYTNSHPYYTSDIANRESPTTRWWSIQTWANSMKNRRKCHFSSCGRWIHKYSMLRSAGWWWWKQACSQSVTCVNIQCNTDSTVQHHAAQCTQECYNTVQIKLCWTKVLPRPATFTFIQKSSVEQTFTPVAKVTIGSNAIMNMG